MRIVAIISFLLCAHVCFSQNAAQVSNYADISSSAYMYRADRKPDANKPESWFALMTYSGQPFNKPVNVKDSAIRKALCALLWEEIRPVKTIKLSWKNNAKRQPKPEDLIITTLDKKNKASSWWNNLMPVKREIKPLLSPDKKTYTYEIDSTININGLVISVANGNGDKFDVPEVSVFTNSGWKSMNVEIEWGFDAESKGKDYSGNIETYDGKVSGLKSIDPGTKIKKSDSWFSLAAAKESGIKFRLDYIGVSNKREIQPYIT
ncbi:MAG: hypothetical protein J7497_14950, partial [Chitinophagaceae bacterium]|nr:hypothetical protein [Chitinophagaceae bacterium]